MTFSAISILNSTRPILFETHDKLKPYQFSGTCYPVKYGDTLYIVSAFHCYENFGILPENTLYPRPNDSTSFLAFDKVTRANAEHARDDTHTDQVLLRVARSQHDSAELGLVVALDLAEPANARLPTHSGIRDFKLRGFAHDMPKHWIDYDERKISLQAYATDGCLGASKSPYDFCYSLRMTTPIPPGMHPNGMSGSPVYGVTYDEKLVYSGTVIGYSEDSGEYVVIGPEILVNCLRKLALEEYAEDKY